MSLAFISPLGKVVSLRYAHGTRSDPFNDENALKKKSDLLAFVHGILSVLFSHNCRGVSRINDNSYGY